MWLFSFWLLFPGLLYYSGCIRGILFPPWFSHTGRLRTDRDIDVSSSLHACCPAMYFFLEALDTSIHHQLSRHISKGNILCRNRWDTIQYMPTRNWHQTRMPAVPIPVFNSDDGNIPWHTRRYGAKRKKTKELTQLISTTFYSRMTQSASQKARVHWQNI